MLLFAPTHDLNPSIYYAQWILAFGHYGGWYLPYILPSSVLPGKALRAPHMNAEIGHMTAMLTNVLALLVVREYYFR